MIASKKKNKRTPTGVTETIKIKGKLEKISPLSHILSSVTLLLYNDKGFGLFCHPQYKTWLVVFWNITWSWIKMTNLLQILNWSLQSNWCLSTASPYKIMLTKLFQLDFYKVFYMRQWNEIWLYFFPFFQKKDTLYRKPLLFVTTGKQKS